MTAGLQGVTSSIRISGMLCAAMLVLSGCGGSPQSGGPPPAQQAGGSAPEPTPARTPCGDPSLAGKTVTFANPSGVKLGGYLLGSGATGIVFANQASADACSWLPYSKTM